MTAVALPTAIEREESLGACLIDMVTKGEGEERASHPLSPRISSFRHSMSNSACSLLSGATGGGLEVGVRKGERGIGGGSRTHV